MEIKPPLLWIVLALIVVAILGCQSKVQTIYLESDSNQKECNK